MTGAARIVLLATLGSALACASTEPAPILPPDEQYARALRLYEAGETDSAIRALQAFTFNYPQDPRVTDARWLMAEAHYAEKDWATAAQEYLNFQRDHPREARAAEALFRAGRAYERMSLRPELDQRDTQRALTIFERLLAEYPGSDFAEQTRERRDRLIDKLAEKAFLNAEFYFDHEEYEAAEIYLVELIERFPRTSWLAPAYAMLARARCERGLEDEAARAFRALDELYPESSAVREVRGDLRPACRGEGGSASADGGGS